jgi:6-phosphogluconolactonase
MKKQDGKELLVYVGTYTAKGSEGIYVYRLDPSSGALTLASVAAGVENPSFLAVDPRGRCLYAVNEVGTFAGQAGGAVSAFSIAPRTGALTLLNQQPSHGAAPCYLSVDRTGQFVLVANYMGGNASVLPIEEGGRLGEATDVVQHRGSGVHPRRQEGPHAHSITLDPANRYAFVADLGLDKIMVYRFDLDHGKLRPHDRPWVQVQAGAGPRHFAFHPSGRYAYLINELDSTLTAFAYDATRGMLQELQTLSALPAGYEGTSYCADVHVSPSGQFLYGSNRGHDSIVVLRIDRGTGQLTYAGHEPTGGKNPRNFAIDPSGTFLFAANQDSDTIVAFRIDQRTGQLTPTGQVTRVSMPVCVKMLALSS